LHTCIVWKFQPCGAGEDGKAELQKLIRSIGANCRTDGKISKSSDILIIGEDPGLAKLRKANSVGAPIVHLKLLLSLVHPTDTSITDYSSLINAAKSWSKIHHVLMASWKTKAAKQAGGSGKIARLDGAGLRGSHAAGRIDGSAGEYRRDAVGGLGPCRFSTAFFLPKQHVEIVSFAEDCALPYVESLRQCVKVQQSARQLQVRLEMSPEGFSAVTRRSMISCHHCNGKMTGLCARGDLDERPRRRDAAPPLTIAEGRAWLSL